MNKVVNIFTLVLLIVLSFFIFGSIYDLSISVYHVRSIHFIPQIVYGISGLILLLGLIRVRRRWEGVLDMKKFNDFDYATQISKKSIQYSIIFFMAEIVFLSFFAYFFYNSHYLDEENLVIPIVLILLFLIIELFLFYIINLIVKNNGKIVLNKNLLAYFDREMHIFYFDGLQRIESMQGMLNFKYKMDLNLILPLNIIPEKELKLFKEKLIEIMEEKSVYVDENVRKLGE